MLMQFFCPVCGRPLQVDSGYCGMQITCPVCNQQIIIPTVAMPSATPVQPQGDIPTQPQGGIPVQAPGSFPTQPQGGVPVQAPGSFPTQPQGGIPVQAPGSFPTQPQGGIPVQAPGSFPAQPQGGFPVQMPGMMPQQGMPIYPNSYPQNPGMPVNPYGVPFQSPQERRAQREREKLERKMKEKAEIDNLQCLPVSFSDMLNCSFNVICRFFVPFMLFGILIEMIRYGVHYTLFNDMGVFSFFLLFVTFVVYIWFCKFAILAVRTGKWDWIGVFRQGPCAFFGPILVTIAYILFLFGVYFLLDYLNSLVTYKYYDTDNHLFRNIMLIIQELCFSIVFLYVSGRFMLYYPFVIDKKAEAFHVLQLPYYFMKGKNTFSYISTAILFFIPIYIVTWFVAYISHGVSHVYFLGLTGTNQTGAAIAWMYNVRFMLDHDSNSSFTVSKVDVLMGLIGSLRSVISMSLLVTMYFLTTGQNSILRDEFSFDNTSPEALPDSKSKFQERPGITSLGQQRPAGTGQPGQQRPNNTTPKNE